MTVDISFVSRQSFGKATARVACSLPKQQQKKNEIIGHMLQTINQKARKQFSKCQDE